MNISRRRWVSAISVVATLILCGVGYLRFGLSPPDLVTQAARVAGTRVLAVLYRADQEWVDRKVSAYFHGFSPQATAQSASVINPFVYEDDNVPYLVEFRRRFELDKLIESEPTEYAAIVRLGGWVGSQFDHGTDAVAGGRSVCDPIKLIEDGRQGKKYWCEIAARLMVHAAASVGLPARVVTISHDGYSWDHAVAEIWSNDFRKWFVVDTDFNLVYEREGVPLSAVELVKRSDTWSADGTLQMRHIANPKASIPQENRLDLYNYIHVDMRNDWCSRSLRSGSPAGSDLATWWTAEQGFRPLLTARVRVDDESRINAPLNLVKVVRVEDARGNPELRLSTFSPYFKAFEVRDVNGAWRRLSGDSIDVSSDAPEAVRVITAGGWKGPELSLSSSE